jgi:outer membrane protein TolC
MTRHLRAPLALLLAILMAALGCHPTQPFYLHEDGDLSHFLASATEIESADVFEPSLDEVRFTGPPLTLSDSEFHETWELSLEEAVSHTMNNSKVVRNLGAVTPFGFSDGLVGRVATGSTVYDTAIVEADPVNGVEAALSAFDAQFSITGSNNGNVSTQTDRPSTFQPNSVINRSLGGLRTDLTKQTATGLRLSARNQTDYSRGDNLLGANQPVDSVWETFFEVEARQPLLRGRGAQINRIPLILARINTDVSLATFESAMRNLLADLENTYWDLLCAYRDLDTSVVARDSAQVVWNNVSVKLDEGQESAQAEAQAREQYFFFRAQTEQALVQLYDIENRLRFLMGLAPSDGRLIRPIDDPTTARVKFDWRAIHVEALTRNAELRQQRWVIKRRELELIAARNQLLPQLDVGATYRWYGAGDHLINADRNGIDFVASPADGRGPRGSTAFDELTNGHYQEASFFFSFQMPVGYRREHAGVRFSQLNLAREIARLEDIELNSTHLITTAYRNLDFRYQNAQTQFNRWKAAFEEVESLTVLYETGLTEIDLVLDAQRRRAQAQSDYYRALCEYNKAITDVHFRKGSLLEYNSIYLSEGPWPEKACWDALGHARERDASYYLNYGWSRPKVISQGPIAQQQGSVSVSSGSEAIPKLVPIPQDAAPNDAPSRQPGPVTDRPEGPELNAPRRVQTENRSDSVVAKDLFDWGNLGLDSSSEPVGTSVQPVSFDE